MQIDRKYIYAGLIGIVTITGALLYLEYKKMMNYVIGLKSIKLNTISNTLVDISVYINFNNKGTLPFDIQSQSYVVYLNGKIAVQAGNAKPIKIITGNNIIPVAIQFNPAAVSKQLGGTSGMLGFILKPEQLHIKIEVKLYVKFLGFSIPIPFTHETTLAQLLATKK